MAYDAFDRLRRWILSSRTATGAADPNDYEEYLYDASGNRTSLRKRDGSILSYQYDALNRMTAKIVPFAWDSNGNLLSEATARGGPGTSSWARHRGRRLRPGR
jgi:YD repeat-containing protein